MTTLSLLMILANLACFWVVLYAYIKHQLGVIWVIGIGTCCLIFIVIQVMALLTGVT